MFGYIQETFLYGYSYLSYNEKGRTNVAMLELIAASKNFNSKK